MKLNNILSAVRRSAFRVAAPAAAIAGGLITSAHAAVDTAGIVSEVADAGTAVGVVGAAVLVVYVGIKAFKMVRAAL